jgi:hypothetical protein
MERVNLGSVIEQAISRFSQNRIGDKPPLFVMISPALTPIPWYDRSLKEFVRMFLYEALLTNDPDAIIEVTLRRKLELKDLNAFVGVRPSCWVQLRVAGRGLKVMEHLINELFAEVGYRCEEWVGVQDSQARLGIFGNENKPQMRLAATRIRPAFLPSGREQACSAANLTDSLRACHYTLTINN